MGMTPEFLYAALMAAKPGPCMVINHNNWAYTLTKFEGGLFRWNHLISKRPWLLGKSHCEVWAKANDKLCLIQQVPEVDKELLWE